MIIRRAWLALFDYVHSELIYSSSPAVQVTCTPEPQQPQPQQQISTSAAVDSAPKPLHDPQLISHLQQRERVYAFIRVPLSLEKFMLFAFWLCADTFLNMFTFLPIRFVFCAFNYLSRPVGYFYPHLKRIMTPAQRCDFLRGFVIVICSAVVCHLDISVFYHLIRTQSIIKLYIFYNMLEIAEKLMASVGQDIMDALFITATEQTYRRPRSRYVVLLFHVALAVIYSCIHTVIFILQAVVLNVAFNSQNKSLLTVMLSNNFVEIKSNVFRKYSKNNLYQVACFDARERFHLVVMMSIVAARNMAQYNWSIDHLQTLLPDMVIVLTCEVFVDWIKHCFITKFNETSSEVYIELRTSLARHVLTASVVSGGADRQDTVANRTGLSLVPLACLIVVVGMQVLKSTDWSLPDPLFLALLVVTLFVFKSILGYCVISAARSIVLPTPSSSSSNMTATQSNNRYVGGHHGRSYSVEDVKFESTKPITWTSLSTKSASHTPTKLNGNVTNGTAVNSLDHENQLKLPVENHLDDYGINRLKMSPQMLAVRRSSPLNELRRTRSNGDLCTIYESAQPTTELNISEKDEIVTRRSGSESRNRKPYGLHLQIVNNDDSQSVKTSKLE